MSEPAYVCMECARTTSGRCVQHSYVSIPKQDILSECIALRKRVDSQQSEINTLVVELGVARKRVEELEAHRSVRMGLALAVERDQAVLRAEKAERERYYEQERNRLNVQQWSEENAKLQAERDEARATKNLHKERYQQSEERAEKAVRERDLALATRNELGEKYLLERERAEKAEREPDTQAAYENRLRISVNESCACGGREPGLVACPACMVWHRMNDGADCEPKAKLPLGHPYSVFVDGDDGRPCTATVGSKGMLWPCGQPRSAHEPM